LRLAGVGAAAWLIALTLAEPASACRKNYWWGESNGYPNDRDRRPRFAIRGKVTAIEKGQFLMDWDSKPSDEEAKIKDGGYKITFEVLDKWSDEIP
jgi:hypothetical protein